MKKSKPIARLAQMACVYEACAPKPGSVNRDHDFADASLEDFLISAVAIGPAFEDAGEVCVGQTVWRATLDTQQLVHSNTNLGIVLLLTPLVKACLTKSETIGDGALGKIAHRDLREKLCGVLSALTVEDARLAFAAIRLAKPGGLGTVSHADVSGEPALTLFQAMALARERDSIAREYTSGFEITFETALPALRESLHRTRDISSAVVQTFLQILSRIPDTLIARKKGVDAAARVSERAHKVLEEGGVFTPRGLKELAAMDRDLRNPANSLNPGTTSDLTAAAVFLALIEIPDLAARGDSKKDRVPGTAAS